jgi:hypothetical protein
MEAYKHALLELNTLNYKNHVSRDLTGKKKLLETLSTMRRQRTGSQLNTAILSINRDKIAVFRKKRGGGFKMKLLRAPEEYLIEQMTDLLISAERHVDKAMKNGCSRCNGGGRASSPNEETSTTTHCADMPVFLPPVFKRWVVLPFGSVKPLPSGKKRLIVEQTGRYDGPMFVPNLPGKSLFWTSNNSRLESRTCCLLDFINKRGIKEWGCSNTSVSSKLVENISLKLCSSSDSDNEFVRHIEQEDINISLLL